jgi:outer membrane protein OmpA-like peptidoglycan-associated protein
MTFLGAIRNPLPAIAVGAVGLVAIMIGQGVPNRHGIEGDLTARSADALRQAGLSGAQVDFTGRDGTIRVTTAADVDRARDIVRAQRGVRVATVLGPDGGTTDPAAAPSPSTSAPGTTAVTLTIRGGRVTLTGAVPSEQAKSALAAAAAATFGANVTDQLIVDPAAGSIGLDRLGTVLGALGKRSPDADVAVADETITLVGAAASESAKQAALDAAKTVAPTVVDHLKVTAPSPPPAPAPPPAEVQDDLRTLPPIGFLTGSATLSPSGRSAVGKAADLLKRNPTIRVRIEGHTDSVGDAGRNLRLSRARAAAVLTRLRSLGVAADRMSSVGFGETRPKVRGDSPSARTANRRVEFLVLS